MKIISALILILFAQPAVSQQLPAHTRDSTIRSRDVMGTFITPATNFNKSGQVIPQNFYTQHLGFFCRQELRMQEAHVPVTFRLGSMEYCNYLEQKQGYR